MSSGVSNPRLSVVGEGSPQSRADDVRQLSGRLVFALYRLVKASQLHADGNQTVQSLLGQAADAAAELCSKAGNDQATIVFASNTVFVNGKLLRASRETHAVALELGGWLDKLGASELVVDRNVNRSDLSAFARVVVEGQKERDAEGKLASAGLTTIRARRVRGGGGDALSEAESTPPARAARTFAAAVIVMRATFAALAAGDRKLPNRVKRVAQKLVSHVDEAPELLVALAAAPSPGGDVGHNAVSTAILSLAMSRQLTRDRLALANVAMSALLLDAGRARLSSTKAATEGMGPSLAIERALNDEELDRLPASAVLTLTSVGKLHPPSLVRSVVAYESLQTRRSHRTGPAYHGKRPLTVLAGVVAVARLFVDLREPALGSSAPSMDDILQLMHARAKAPRDVALVHLLVAALGFFPVGTLVELSSGEVAVVAASPTMAIDFARPPVRILFGASGKALSTPIDLDLGAATREPDRRSVRRPLTPTPERAALVAAMLPQAIDVARKAQQARVPSASVPELPRSSHSWSSPDASLSVDEVPQEMLADLTWLREAGDDIVEAESAFARAARTPTPRSADPTMAAPPSDPPPSSEGVVIDVDAPAIEERVRPSSEPAALEIQGDPTPTPTPAPVTKRAPPQPPQEATRIFTYDEAIRRRADPRVDDEAPPTPRVDVPVVSAARDKTAVPPAPRPSKSGLPTRPVAEPTKVRPALTERDLLLAAFLADSPLDELIDEDGKPRGKRR